MSPHISLLQQDPHLTGLVCDTRPFCADRAPHHRARKEPFSQMEAYGMRLLVPCKGIYCDWAHHCACFLIIHSTTCDIFSLCDSLVGKALYVQALLRKEPSNGGLFRH